MLFPASVLLRRADAVAVIGAALLAKAGGAGTGGSPCWSAAGLGGGLVTPDHGGSPTRCWRVITKLADRSAAQRRGEMGCR